MKGATTRSDREHRRFAAAAVAAAALAVGAWSWAPPVPASDEATYRAAYEAAVAARKAAAEVGFEWRDIKKTLRRARKLAKNGGEYTKAVELANQARRQGELGQIQAEEQEAAWRAAVLK